MRPTTQQKIIVFSEFELYEQLKVYLSQLENYIQKAQTPTVILGDCEISLSNVMINYDKDLRIYYAKRLLRAGLHFSNANRALGLSFVVLNRLIATHSIYYKRLKGKKTRFSYLQKNNTRTIRLQASIFARMIAMFLENTGNDPRFYKLESGDSIQVFLSLYTFCSDMFERVGMPRFEINTAFDSLIDVFGDTPCLKFQYCMISGTNYLYPVDDTDPKLRAWMVNPAYKDKSN